MAPTSCVTLHVRASRFHPTGADRAPTSEEAAPIKLNNQQTKLDQATPVFTLQNEAASRNKTLGHYLRRPARTFSYMLLSRAFCLSYWYHRLKDRPRRQVRLQERTTSAGDKCGDSG